MSGQPGGGDIHAGQTLRFQDDELVARCPRIYRGTVSYVQTSTSTAVVGNGGQLTGHDAVLVGRFSFRVPQSRR
jgi:hypothetical protein